MFLARLARLGRTDERGSVLIAVIGVMVVGLILTALIATTVVSGFGHTTAARAGVQSHAAADAGVVAARTGLYTPGNCAGQPTPGKYTSSAPVYSVTVQYDVGFGWQTGCPTLAATQIRLVSTGTAAAAGVAGVSSGDTSKVEAVFQYLTPGPPPSGSSIYLYGGGQVEANSNFDLQDGNGTGLMVKNGDLVCDKNNAVINGSVAVYGNLTFTSNCSINKNAWVTGTATLGTGSILGNLAATNVSPNPPGSHVGGTYTNVVTMPVVPKWADVGYNPGAWIDSLGFPYPVLPPLLGLGCTLTSGNMGGPGTPVILDARGCTGGLTASNNTTLRLTSDVVIYAESFNFLGLNSVVFQSATTAAHRIWFITPDYVNDDTPTCNYPPPPPPAPSAYNPALPVQGDFSIKNGFVISAPIAAMLYTPCAFQGKNGFVWNGQIYAGAFSHIQNNPSFTFVKMGIAGANLGDGQDDLSNIHKPQPGSVISMRDFNGVG